MESPPCMSTNYSGTHQSKISNCHRDSSKTRRTAKLQSIRQRNQQFKKKNRPKKTHHTATVQMKEKLTKVPQKKIELCARTPNKVRHSSNPRNSTKKLFFRERFNLEIIQIKDFLEPLYLHTPKLTDKNTVREVNL